MSKKNQQEPPLRAVNMGLFPTMNSLDDVIALAESKLPITDTNELRTLMFIYHNTLLNQLKENHGI